jgi:hypothetical protein
MLSCTPLSSILSVIRNCMCCVIRIVDENMHASKYATTLYKTTPGVQQCGTDCSTNTACVLQVVLLA